MKQPPKPVKVGPQLAKIMREVLPQYGKVAHAKASAKIMHNIFLHASRCRKNT